MAQDWDIKPRSSGCHDCETPFVDRQVCYSMLRFEPEGYQRRDLCESCWNAARERAGRYSSWQGVYRAPPEKPEPAVRKETAESLLRRLMEDPEEAAANVMFILAVMLERNRTLVERATQNRDDGTRLRIYEHRRTGETFVVPEPVLQLDQLEQVQREVVDMLGGGTTAPPPPAQDAATCSTTS
jgi:hypothetical protein